jgi:hypothetical protein
MATDLSTIVGGLKQVYGNDFEKLQNLEPRAINEIAKSMTAYSPGGAGFYGAVNDYGNESIGAISETEAFRTIDNENYAQYKVVPKVLVAPIEFSGLTAAAANSDEEAFVGMVVDALSSAKDRLLADENRQFYGLGNGALASPAGTTASDATSFSVDSVQYLRANMVIDIFNGATKTVDSKRISSIDRAARVVYLSTSLGAALATSDVLVKENVRDSAASDGKEMMGLRGIVDDSTDLTTFQNINSVTNREWRARRIDASSANLTSDLLQRLIDDVAIVNGKEPDKLIMHRKQRRKYLDIVVPQKRYADGKMDSGFQKLEFNGTELWLDKDCQDDTVYAISLDKIKKFELEAIAMGKHEGSDTYLRKAGYDAFQAYWRHYCNFGTTKRNAHGKIVSLAKPTGLS